MNKKFLIIVTFLGLFFIYFIVSKKENSNDVGENILMQNKNPNRLPSKKDDHKNLPSRSLASTNNDTVFKDDPIDPKLQVVLDRYQAHELVMIGETKHYLSDFMAIPKNEYETSMGKMVEEKLGYVIFNPQGSESDKAKHLTVNSLTHAIGVVTGKVLVQLDHDHTRAMIANILKGENFKLGLLRPYVEVQEVQVYPTNKSFEVNKKLLALGFKLAEVEIISSEYKVL